MKIKKQIAILTLAATMSLFADGMSTVSSLVEELNNTTDVKERSVLLKKLDIEIAVMDKKDVPKAKAFIQSTLKK
jgi:hypothetical protein